MATKKELFLNAVQEAGSEGILASELMRRCKSTTTGIYALAVEAKRLYGKKFKRTGIGETCRYFLSGTNKQGTTAIPPNAADRLDTALIKQLARIEDLDVRADVVSLHRKAVYHGRCALALIEAAERAQAIGKAVGL